MKDNTIFIHIPKTGGTSINAAMQNTTWQTMANFNYRHIILKTKYSNAGDIFSPKNFEKYKQYKIFMMLRHPVDRVTSEYYFIKERKNFIDLLNKKPTTFKSYIKNRQTQNGVVTFLKGRRFYDIKAPNERDLDDILDAIDQIPIHVGIFEEFDASLQYFTDVTKIELNKNIDVKRMTFRRPSVNQLDEETKKLILDNNQLDWELYQYALDKFNKIKDNFKSPEFVFKKDKYTHVIPYAMQTCLFNFCMENEKYIQQNLKFFKELTFFLTKDLKITDGEIYTKTWNEAFVHSVAHHFPNSSFAQKIEAAFDPEKAPLDTTYKIGKVVDRFFKEEKHNAHAFFAPMTFIKNLVPKIEEPKSKVEKKSFFNRFFGK